MGSLKLPHASGNSMSIAAPATNPASDLELKLPATIGTANQYLKNSGTAGTLEFGGAGKILQVVSSHLTTQMTSTSTSFVDIGLSASITPSATSSKILILINVAFSLNGDNNASLQLLRDSTVINSGVGGTHQSWATINANATAFRYSNPQQACNYLDSPSTTSAITYKVQGKIHAGAGVTFAINRRQDDTEMSNSSNITLLEVGA